MLRIKLLDPIEGYESEAEYRVPAKGESFIQEADDKPKINDYFRHGSYICLTKNQTCLERLGLKVGFGYISANNAFLISGPEDAVRSWMTCGRGWTRPMGTCLLKPEVGCTAALTENSRSLFEEYPLGSPELIEVFGGLALLPADLERAQEVKRLQGILEQTQRDLENLK